MLFIPGKLVQLSIERKQMVWAGGCLRAQNAINDIKVIKKDT
jgi:hypothetical protein